MRLRNIAVCLATAGLALSCGSPPVPEAYGVFARAGRDMYDLSDDNRQDDFNLPPEVELIVFERGISSQPEHQIRIRPVFYRRATIQYEFQTGFEKPETLPRNPDDLKKVAIAVGTQHAEEEVVTGAYLHLRFKPLGRDNDMLAVVPEQQFSRGAYTLFFSRPHHDHGTFGFNFGEPYLNRFFGGQADPYVHLDEYDTSYDFGILTDSPGCVDEYLLTVPDPGRPFSEDDWFKWFRSIDDFMQLNPPEWTYHGQLVLTSFLAPCESAKDAGSVASKDTAPDSLGKIAKVGLFIIVAMIVLLVIYGIFGQVFGVTPSNTRTGRRVFSRGRARSIGQHLPKVRKVVVYGSEKDNDSEAQGLEEPPAEQNRKIPSSSAADSQPTLSDKRRRNNAWYLAILVWLGTWTVVNQLLGLRGALPAMATAGLALLARSLYLKHHHLA